MNISFYTGASGLIAQQHGMNIYSNNIANINTVGYKALRPSFADCVYTIQRETETDWQTGHGQYLFKTDFLFEEGGFQTTEQPLDFALTNDGFYIVEAREGTRFLTRDGSFNMTRSPVSEEEGAENAWFLVNDAGEYVLDNNFNRIVIPLRVDYVPITDENGQTYMREVLTDQPDYDALKDTIGIFTVPNAYGLDQADTNHFEVTPRSGEPVPAPDYYTMEQGYLEMSTTDLASEMVHLIETQRSYQMASKIVSTSDELIRIANNLRT